MTDKFDKIREYVEKELSCSAHSMDHVLRVYNLAINLAEGSDVDVEVVKAAALLHDIARVKEDNDPTGNTNHAMVGAEMAGPILQELGFSQDKISHIQDCIRSHRYRTGYEAKTNEAKMLFDADKLDTLGAIGIARAYVWVGRNGAKIYSDVDLDSYVDDNLGGKLNGRIQDKTKHSPQIEFETKTKFLKEKLHTEKAKQICDERIAYYRSFLDRLEKEVKGNI